MAAAAMFENSSLCYKIGNFHPILMQIGTQTKKSMPSSEITKAEVQANFQDGLHCRFGNSNAC
jgi:hypothetical protein